MEKFLLGLVIALILGILANVILGYIKFGYFQNPDKIFGGLFKPKSGQNQMINKDIKDCKDLVSSASSFGSLKITVISNGKPVENLEVDLSTKPGPIRCMQKTDQKGTAVFTNVPTGKTVIYFNNADFPKEFSSALVQPVEIISGQVLEKTIELKGR